MGYLVVFSNWEREEKSVKLYTQFAVDYKTSRVNVKNFLEKLSLRRKHGRNY